MTDSKICTRCGVDKPLDEYRNQSGLTPGGKPRETKRTCCRQCERSIQREKYVPAVAEPNYPRFRPIVSAGPWKEQANCIGVDADLFFPTQGEPTQPAKNVCAGCPVRLQCLEYALANREPFGIWGGLSAKQRDRILSRRNAERRVAS